MKAVVQRVSRGSVSIEGKVVGAIGQGLVILLGVTADDDETSMAKLANKIIDLRIFQDDKGKTNLSIEDVGGEILVVSQFTLLADCRKGRRPSFFKAGDPAEACRLYEEFISECAKRVSVVEHGQFGAVMQVDIFNDGPFTIVLDTDEL